MTSAGGYTLRQAEERDAEVLAAFRVASFIETHGESPPALPAHSAATFAQFLATGACIAWIAESPAQQAVGCAAMLIYPRLPSPELAATTEGYLLNVYTLPEWRRRGVATELVNEAVAAGRTAGLARIRLHATQAGSRIYRAAGFSFRDDEMECVL